jgi:predicted dehydrogenase
MTVRVGVIGPGGMGGSHVRAVLAHPDAELVAACDVNTEVLDDLREKVEGLKTYTDYNELLDAESLDVVCVILPHHLYPDCVGKALAKGCHVIKEKPLAKDLADGIAMAQAARDTGKQLFCGSQRKFASSVERVAHIFEANLLGDIYLAQATIRYRWTPAWQDNWRWRGKKAQSGGVAIVDSGWHALDTLAMLIGAPSRVYASTGGARPITNSDYDVDLLGAMVFDYANGAVAHVLATFACQPSEFRLCLHGSKGDLELTPEELRWWSDGVLTEVTRFDPDGAEQVFDKQFAHFVECIEKGEPGRSDIASALDVQRTIEAAYRSAGAGQPVDMADVETL